MYKLKVISGPNQGESFSLKPGENAIGRHSDNVIVLPSGRVSKKHCVIAEDADGELKVVDADSANGTFVNGALVRSRKLAVGDRVSVGEYVLQLVEVKARSGTQNLQLADVVQFPRTAGVPETPLGFGQTMDPFQNLNGANASGTSGAGGSASKALPQDLLGKVSYGFEKGLMPFFYNLLLKTQWRVMVFGLIVVLCLATVVVSVQPVISTARDLVMREISKRAQGLAKELVDLNAPLLASGNENRTDTMGIDRLEGVRMAVLVDMDGRVMAPASKLNQLLVVGPEARVLVKARMTFNKGRETGFFTEEGESTIVAVEPIKVLNSTLGRNVIIGMGIVSIDSSASTPALGEIGMFYSQGIILSCVVGLFIFFVIYRLTLRPFVVLNEDLDRVLKGELSQVTSEYSFEELHSLWEILNSLSQRAFKAAGANATANSGTDAGSGANLNASDFEAMARTIGGLGRQGVVLCDQERRIVYLNEVFEEMSGIRADRDMGQPFTSVARDQGFETLLEDLFSRSGPGAEGIREDFEFNGVAHTVHTVAFGPAGGNAVATLFFFLRSEGG